LDSIVDSLRLGKHRAESRILIQVTGQVLALMQVDFPIP
jgi:hypothetical protein